MADKIVHMPPPIDPIDQELEESCRRLAARYRRNGDLEAAEHFERVAERVARARMLQCGSAD